MFGPVIFEVITVTDAHSEPVIVASERMAPPNRSVSAN